MKTKLLWMCFVVCGWVAVAASPAGADTTISNSFTNHTGISVNDFHWDLNGLYNVISTNAGQAANFFSSEATTQDATDTYLDFTNGVVGNGQSTTIAATVGGNSESVRSANWTLDGVGKGNAYAPMSYSGSYGAATQQWVIQLDNKNIPAAGRLLVTNLKFAVTNQQFNASTISTAGLVFSPPESSFIIEPGSDITFDVFTGDANQFVVADADINYVNSGGDIMSGTEGHFTAEATPEPATLSLLAVGGAMMLRRRHKH